MANVGVNVTKEQLEHAVDVTKDITKTDVESTIETVDNLDVDEIESVVNLVNGLFGYISGTINLESIRNDNKIYIVNGASEITYNERTGGIDIQRNVHLEGGLFYAYGGITYFRGRKITLFDRVAENTFIVTEVG